MVCPRTPKTISATDTAAKASVTGSVWATTTAAMFGDVREDDPPLTMKKDSPGSFLRRSSPEGQIVADDELPTRHHGRS